MTRPAGPEADGPPREHRYGAAPQQVAELWLPARGAAAARGVVVLLHGGFWRAGYDRSLQHPVARELRRRGWAVWNVDYRGVGAGGGWTATFDDVAAGVDALAALAPDAGLSTRRVAVVGHSAGGTLALWSAARRRLPPGAPGAAPVVVPAVACSQAGVDDLVTAARRRLGDGAVLDLMGAGPDAAPDRYALASPQHRLPLGVPLLTVTTTADREVPPDYARRFAAAARSAGDDARCAVVPGEDHYAHLDPGSRAWAVVSGWLDAVVAAPGAPRRYAGDAGVAGDGRAGGAQRR